MCDVVDSSPYIVNRRRSNKDRRCRGCRETIRRGQSYVRIVWFEGRDASLVTQCDRCHALFKALQRLTREPVAFDLDCGDYIEDPEHPLQWLAFALPSDFAAPAKTGGEP